MKKFIQKILTGTRSSQNADLLNEFIQTQQDIKKLPAFSNLEKVQFDQDVSIGHLYYSSKIEGTHLDEKRLNQAIHAKRV
ncbi:MAG: hypothetical protein V4519_01175 [Patescibacteria group bacterium]